MFSNARSLGDTLNTIMGDRVRKYGERTVMKTARNGKRLRTFEQERSKAMERLVEIVHGTYKATV